ncbi:MAG: hypothetical protein KA275_04210 [Chitinophagaceae bacterium]|nr:hypothetical protein [Chitinophagaceae bacterium]
MKKIILICFVLLNIYSCNKFKIADQIGLESDWLLPLAKGKIGFKNLKELENNSLSHDIPSFDIGYNPGVPINVPALNIPEVGPYAQPIMGWIKSLKVKNLKIELSFTNAFPITIGTGTKISFRRDANTSDATNLIYSHTVLNDILPNQQYDFSIDILNSVIEDTVFIYLEQFSSPGGNNITFSTTPSILSISLKVLEIENVELYTNKQASFNDTVQANFSQDTNGFDTTVSGKINVFVDNAMPLNTNFQLYFIDSLTNNIIDSLFNTRLIVQGINTNSLTGTPLSINSSKNEILVNAAKVQRIKSANKAIIDFDLNTNGYSTPTVLANDETYLGIQFTGDLKLKLKIK